MKCTTEVAVHEANEVKIEQCCSNGTRWVEISIIHDGEKLSVAAFLTDDAKVEIVGVEDLVAA